VKTIEAVAESLKVELPKKSCEPMKEFVKEGVKDIARKLKHSDQDAALIATGRKIEQFEIASYRALCAQAEAMGYEHEHALLTSTLDQEELADALLAGLAKGGVPLKKLVERASLKKAGAPSA
jgi:ferritin-like metal-binding protein YciE